MSIEQTDTVDFVSVDSVSDNLLLTISDHLAWDEGEGEGEHLLLLQKKLNAYLRFIESGAISKKFPEAKGRNVVINLVGQFPLSEKASFFLSKATSAIQASGVNLKFSLVRAN
jgi:hypothetical protein